MTGRVLVTEESIRRARAEAARHNHTRWRPGVDGPWSPCPDTCPSAPARGTT